MIAHAMNVAHSTPIGKLFPSSCQIKIFNHDATLKEIFDYFSIHSSDAVLIEKEGNTVGIMTLKDMVKSIKNCDNLTSAVHAYMTYPLNTFHYSMTISEVLDSIATSEYDKIVVADKNKIIGIIDRRDLLSICYNQISPLIKHEYNMMDSMMEMVEGGERDLFVMATTDRLTGIGNRRLLEEAFYAHQKLENRFSVTMFLVMFDIDGFKHINDVYGHNIGDAVLKELTMLVSGSIRKSDIFARWGGEEFVILLRYSDPDSVVGVVEQIRNKIDIHRFETIQHLTCSFGLTDVKLNENLEETLERADKGLYRAKTEGKNRVCTELKN